MQVHPTLPDARGPSTDEGLVTRCRTAIERGVSNLAARQEPDGHWAGDYGGPLFLLPGLLITCEITGTPLTDTQRERMIVYLRNVQNVDGGWGLHVEDDSTVFGTALNYVALRILGVPSDDPDARRARERLHALGGAAGIPMWGKFWLAVLGVYDWEGIHPLPPELYLLPRRFPLNPGNFWCHTRQVFLPMSAIYAQRQTGPETPLVHALREELYVEPYGTLDWPSLRGRVAKEDLYSPHTPVLKAVNKVLGLYERHPLRPLRNRALRFVSDQMHHEDETTAYLTIGPVSKAIQMLAVWFEDPEGDAFKRHVARMDDYLYDGVDGMKMQGYQGSQLWDAAFAMLAILESGLPAREGAFFEVLDRAHRFVDENQVREDIPEGSRYFRDRIKGAWPFSKAEQGWTVSDCTAEGMKVALGMREIASAPIALERLHDSVDVLLRDQNDDGGWSEYERSRAPRLAELFNAAEVFGDIMRGYSYTECTSACIQGLLAFHRARPEYRAQGIKDAVDRGLRFLRSRQREDGSWYGGWGICFTYGTWFGIDGLVAGGRAEDLPRIERAGRFLMSKQHGDGGFGESYRACVEKRWVGYPESLPIQTAWALLGLLGVRAVTQGVGGLDDAIERGIRFLLSRQEPEGDFRQDVISGVFNRNCMIHYDNYRHIMPLWALSRYYRSAASPA